MVHEDLHRVVQEELHRASEVAVAVIRSTMRSTSEAFERFNEAVERLTTVAEESVSTMGNATVKAATGKAVPKPAPKRASARK